MSRLTCRRLLRRLIVGVCLVSGGLVATPGLAAAATRYVSPSGSDSGACTGAGAPCRSLAHAYRQSGPGDIVQMAGGNYGAQTIPTVAGRSAPAVDFRPAAGASVSFSDINIQGHYVTVRDFSAPFVDIDAGSTQIRRRQRRRRRHRRDVDQQRCVTCRARAGASGRATTTRRSRSARRRCSYNVTFDGVDFHDSTATDSQVHTECLWAGDVQGLTVKNSLFRNCAYFGLFLTHLPGHVAQATCDREQRVRDDQAVERAGRAVLDDGRRAHQHDGERSRSATTRSRARSRSGRRTSSTPRWSATSVSRRPARAA